MLLNAILNLILFFEPNAFDEVAWLKAIFGWLM